ncbi:MAG TPA: ribosome biogenesis GTP-binding protein YihA/YsxC [Solimonas sp.]|nr:ribosome biogenesis GTP-binding protein YihA/YsxC [Solimonas sp.]
MQNPFASAHFLNSCAGLDQLPQDEVAEIAFAGRSNAGKSSALNLICNQKHLARVSKTPGRTQLINLFEVPGGRFADLPGYGYADVSREMRAGWGRLIGAYLEGRTNLRGIVLIMDIRQAPADADRQMLDWVVHRGLPCHCLLSKADKLGYGAAKNQLLKLRRECPGDGISSQLFSATERTGLAEVQEKLLHWLKPVGPETPP